MSARRTRARWACAAAAIAATIAPQASAQPANDECTSPEPIAGDGAFPFSTLGATTNPDSGQGFERFETGLGFNEIRKDVWYLWTAPENAHAELEVLESFGILIPKAAVYDGPACPPAEADILDAQHDVTGEMTLRWDAVEGRQYLIQIGSADAGEGATGEGFFSISLAEPTGACCSEDGAAETTQDDCADAEYLGDFVRAVTYNAEPVAFAFEDIRDVGTKLGEGFSEVEIGFPFPFYNETFDSAVFSPKGYLVLGPVPGNEPTYASILPDISEPDSMVAALWSNWTTAGGPDAEPGQLHVATLGTPGEDLRFIAQWTNLSEPIVFGLPAGDTTFQTVLFEDGTIEHRWLQIESQHSAGFGGRLTSGIENDQGRRFIDIPDLLDADETAVRITPTTACDTTCPADVNGDGELSVLDFVAFQALFTAGDPAADCDDSADLDVLDFVCFQALFAAGCG